MTTFVSGLIPKIESSGFIVTPFDAVSKGAAGLALVFAAEPGTAPALQVVAVDHLGKVLPAEFRRLLGSIVEGAARVNALCLWCGNLDARSVDHQLGVKLCSVPSAHVSFPILTRDELLAVYLAIADRGGCRWGDAVLYLMLDLCGTDLSLVRSATQYLHGDWSDRLYDESVWDRVQEWLRNDEIVDACRARLKALPPGCEAALALIRFGGKPQCLRAELIEEVDDSLRRLCLDGFIIPNLLPGFYQLRNLVVRFLLDESVQPEFLFRRATNERAAALLHDAETMLRQILTAVFARIGVDAARERMEAMQQPKELIDKKLYRSLLEWAKQKCAPEAVKGLNDLLLQHRTEFKKANSVWIAANETARREDVSDDGSAHIRCIDNLTLDQLGRLVLGLIEEVLPRLANELARKRARERWQEGVAKVSRLRNLVAHLRNVGFQDIEDLTHTLEGMRRDLIEYGGWKGELGNLARAAEPVAMTKR
jgi:hypothetical protein